MTIPRRNQTMLFQRLQQIHSQHPASNPHRLSILTYAHALDIPHINKKRIVDKRAPNTIVPARPHAKLDATAHANADELLDMLDGLGSYCGERLATADDKRVGESCELG